MKTKQLWKMFLVTLCTYGMTTDSFAETLADPCAGPSELLNIIDRPTAGDSACVVPYKKAVLEMGYQYQQLTHSAGHAQNYPEAELRIGLPYNNEFVMLLPNYIHVMSPSVSGASATTVGIKHELGYTQHWLGAVESLITLPNGSAVFGSKGTGVAVNGIVSYTFNPQFNLTFMFGVTSQTTSSALGGQRFASLNPDLVFTYSPTQQLDIYGEIYGQTKTGPGLGSGLNFDGGLIYLLMPNIAIDAEIGRRISGTLAGFNQYIGTGISLMF